MTDEIKQNIKSGDDSVNVQGEKVTVNLGITYADAKEIALSVFKDNFIKMSEEASKIADQRVEKLTDRYLEQLKERNPNAINNLIDPAVQYSLYNAQLGYAKSGNEDLSEILVELLINRTIEDKDDFRKIIYEESIAILPKITNQQLRIISILFLLNDVVFGGFKSLEEFNMSFLTLLLPYFEELEIKYSDFLHLEYTGCCALDMSKIRVHSGNIYDIFLQKYAKMFSKGFTIQEFENEFDSKSEFEQFLIECLHDPRKKQFNFDNYNDPRLNYYENNLVVKITNFNNKYIFSRDEVKNYVLINFAQFEYLFKIWENTYFKRTYLTSVGLSIASSLINTKIEDKVDLGIFLL